MKVLVVGSYLYEMYEPALSNALKDIGEEVYDFKWKDYFYRGKNQVLKFSARYQNRFLYGPTINTINRNLYKLCTEIKPDLVFVYRGTHIQKKTVERIKALGIIVFSYNNDDPFSGVPSNFYWRHYLRAASTCIHNFVYRVKNIKDMHAARIINSSLLRSYYIENKNFFIPIEKTTDVLFIGHYEDDGRDEYIMQLISNNINVKIYGDNEWRHSKYYDKLKNNIELRALDLCEYNEKINKAKIALVFLSKINTDTYTRRCFEIPATKTMMMSEYTQDLNSMFEEGKEAEYFRNKDELLDKIVYYLENHEKRCIIGENGYARLMADGHEIKDRAREVIKWYNEYRGAICK